MEFSWKIRSKCLWSFMEYMAKFHINSWRKTK